ncbi:MAG: hypothetical protein K1W39_16925 [Lachnospiraceae bacterium]|nr:hypothetical protein [Lachnospiraceae bacterium]
MNKQSVNISSLVILLSLLCFIMEVCIYYFIPQRYTVIIFTIISSLCLSHFFLESSLNYDYNYIHASFMVITSLAFGIIVYIIQPNQWIIYDYSIVVLILANWLIPFIYCCIRDLFDRGPRFDDFNLFFHRMSKFFIIIYILAILKQYFITPFVPPYDAPEFGAHIFVPFMTTAEHIEEMLNTNQDIIPVILYIIEIACFGIPFGYFSRVYLKNRHFLLQLLAYLVFPFILEAAQQVTGLGRCAIDDYVIFLIGAVIGIIIYQIMNSLFMSVATRDFTVDRNHSQKNFHFE